MEPAPEPLILHTIERDDDPLLPHFARLYETSFPERERLPLAELLAARAPAPGSDAAPKRLLAALDPAGAGFVGLAVCERHDRNLFLEYLAVVPEQRNAGLGTHLLRALRAEMADAASGSAVDGRDTVPPLILFEAEDPSDFPLGTGERRLAERRLFFYRRQGAYFLIRGLRYRLTLPHWPEATPLLLGFLPCRESDTVPDAAEALQVARRMLPPERFALTEEPPALA